MLKVNIYLLILNKLLFKFISNIKSLLNKITRWFFIFQVYNYIFKK